MILISSVYSTCSLPKAIETVLQQQLRLGFNLAKSPELSHGGLYVLHLERYTTTPYISSKQWSAPREEWLVVEYKEICSNSEFRDWVASYKATTLKTSDNLTIDELIEKNFGKLWAKYSNQPVVYGILRLTVDEAGIEKERYVSSTVYSFKSLLLPNQVQVKQASPTLPEPKARQTPPNQPTVSELLHLFDVIKLPNTAQNYGMVVKIIPLERKGLKFFDIGYIGAFYSEGRFQPKERPNRYGEYKNYLMLRQVVAIDGQLQLMYSQLNGIDITIEIVARQIIYKQNKLF